MIVNGIVCSGSLTLSPDGSIALHVNQDLHLVKGQPVEVYEQAATYCDRIVSDITDDAITCRLIPQPASPEERIAELEAQNEMLTECLLEISEILYS